MLEFSSWVKKTWDQSCTACVHEKVCKHKDNYQADVKRIRTLGDLSPLTVLRIECREYDKMVKTRESFSWGTSKD